MDSQKTFLSCFSQNNFFPKFVNYVRKFDNTGPCSLNTLVVAYLGMVELVDGGDGGLSGKYAKNIRKRTLETTAMPIMYHSMYAFTSSLV